MPPPIRSLTCAPRAHLFSRHRHPSTIPQIFRQSAIQIRHASSNEQTRLPAAINRTQKEPQVSALNPNAPTSRDRGPTSSEDTQTDFGALNILGNQPAPATGIDACTNDGFHLNNDVKISGAGVLLVAGEWFRWKPWVAKTNTNAAPSSSLKPLRDPGSLLRNARGQFSLPASTLGVLDLVYPKPDLLILGTGSSVAPLDPETKRAIMDMGIRIELQDTRNAAAQFNLLATERGIQWVAAALVPIG